MPLKFMVDTGASTLVLPQSLAASLGYAANQLEFVHVQTANGNTTGLAAMMQSVRVGEAKTARVAVTFVDDQLLGMSFLSRFRMTIDGSNGTLQLEKSGRLTPIQNPGNQRTLGQQPPFQYRHLVQHHGLAWSGVRRACRANDFDP